MASAGLPVPATVWVTAGAHCLWVDAGMPEQLPSAVDEELEGCLDRLEAQQGDVFGYAVPSSDWLAPDRPSP